MSDRHGELIQALKVLKNVKEKRHGIKALSNLCANRAFQVRIVKASGWKDAILPLIISLDDDCRKYASLAIANLSTCPAVHEQLLEEDVVRHLAPILQSEEVSEVVIYVLNALGNFALTPASWPQFAELGVIKHVVPFIDQADREEILINSLFCLSNMTGDPQSRAWMMRAQTYRTIWQHMTENRNLKVMQYSLAILRGLAVEPEAQDVLPRLHLVPHLIGIFTSAQATGFLKTMVLDILLHFSFKRSNAQMMLQPNVVAVIESAARGEQSIDYVPVGAAIIANLCENIEQHDFILSSHLFEIMSDLVSNDTTAIQMHGVRAMMHLCLSPKYHHVVLATGVMTNVLPIAMTNQLPVEMRANALQMLGAVCATHPTTPTEDDTMNLLFLVCNDKENLEVRRASMMVIANASSDKGNTNALLNKSYLEALIITLSRCQDIVLVDYLMQFFHNICKLDSRAGSMMTRCGYEKHMFAYERLESLSIASAIYLCDTCRQMAEDHVVRSQLMQGMILKTMLDAWVVYLEEPQLAPHLALMASSFAYHTDTHEEFVLQGGVRLVIELYSRSPVEHVRLCCLLTLLYLAETEHARKCIAEERGLMMLLTAAENETHIDLVTNALKAMIPFAASDDYRPEMGQEGAIDTCASFLFSENLSLQQLGAYLLQNLLELRQNRRILLGLSSERKCEEDYLEPLVRFLPKVNKGPPKRITKMKKKNEFKKLDESNLAPHDPFMLRTVIHCIALLSLEYSKEVFERYVELSLPPKFYDIFYSESIDKSSGEAIILFFANILHCDRQMQARIMKGVEVIPMLLSARDMNFSAHTVTRSLSALLSISRVPDFRRMVVTHLDLIMASVNSNLSLIARDEDFYSAAAVHCALLCELARASTEFHEKMAEAGVVEAFLVFMTVAGKGVNDEMCLELLMGAVFGISALVSSPRTGERCMASMLFPTTRLQLFMSLLRLPAADVISTYFAGTIGLRTLQRVAAPDISPEELQVAGLTQEQFIERCHVNPSFFVCRNVVRTLCLLLAHHEMAVRVQQAIAPSRVVPTCLFAMRDTTDTYINVYGYLLVATFSKHLQLQPGFVNDSSIINELLTGCRRGSASSGDDSEEQSVALQLDSVGKGGAMWTPKSITQNKYLLGMISLTNFAESIREVYRIDEEAPARGDGESDYTNEDSSALTISNRVFMKKLAAVCLKDLDTETIVNTTKMTEVQEFSALLKVIVLHNTFVQKVMLESHKRGGEVKVQKIGVSPEFMPARPSGLDLVPKELRIIFKSLKQLQHKTHGLLEVVEHCLDTNRGQQLVNAILECLSGLTFLSPMVVLDPYEVYRLLIKAPERMHCSLMMLLCNALADEDRIEKTAEQDPGEMISAQSDFLFPLLSASTLKVRQHTLAMLSNLGPRSRFMQFIMNSGVLRVIRPLPDRAYFIEHFGLVIECVRLLTNLTCQMDTHVEVVTESSVGFLRDVLKFCARQILYDLKGPPGRKVEYEYITATFEEDDVPPLGLKIRWEVPPYISDVLPDHPASTLEEPLLPGDELIEVNGIDVSEMEQTEIQPLFEQRPLTLIFRREPDRPKQSEEERQEELEGPELAMIGKLDTYGDAEQYLECFNLALLTLHNIATNNRNHDKLLAEPKILDTMLDIISSEVLSPSLRRICFSLLTCMAQQKEISGRIFQDMAEYFRSCERGDPSLQKYIICCANLFYTSMKPEEVVPDIGMLMFVGKLASMETASSSNRSLVEVLHGMARAPLDKRADFVCRETMVVTVNFVEQREQWDVQLRAFEASYFLTLGACDPMLWASLELVPRMARAAGKFRELAGRDPELRTRADGLFELTMRAADLCLGHEPLVRQLSMPEMDRYLMDLLAAEDKPPTLMHCAAHLMTDLLKSVIGQNCYTRWRAMGLGEKLIRWFKNHQQYICEGVESPHERGVNGEVTMGDALDSVLHMLIFAVEMDPDILQTLVADDVVSSVAHRILDLAGKFQQRLRDPGAGPVDLSAESVSFRTLAQLLTALASHPRGLDAMGKLNLAVPLSRLLELPSEDFRIPVLIILCSLCAHKDACERLFKDGPFLQYMKGIEQRIKNPRDGPMLKEEIEYLVCIVDRTCCYPDLAVIVQAKFTHLLLALPTSVETAAAQLMSLRALARCAFIKPECLESLPSEGIACMHYMMSAVSSLRSGKPDNPDSSLSIQRRKMMGAQGAMFSSHPAEARLIEHFCRAILCEAVSISRGVCQGMFEDLDCMGLLTDVEDTFAAVTRPPGDDEEVGQVAPQDAEVSAAAILNNLVAAMHILLNVIFRQTHPGRGDSSVADAIPANYIPKALQRLFEVVYSCLRLDEFQTTQEPKPGSGRDVALLIAGKLVADIRVIFYLSAIMREICCAPPDSVLLSLVRTESYFKAVQAATFIATNRLQKVKQGRPPKSLFSVPLPGGVRESPLLNHLEDFDLAHIFEHILVCSRHMLVQVMYAPVPRDELPNLLWMMRPQEQSTVHTNALKWIPEILQRYHKYPAIKMEVIRYICSAATFYVAPCMDAQLDLLDAAEGVDGVTTRTPSLAVGAFSLLQPDVLSILTEVLETSSDPCALSLAALAVSNLAGYERSFRKAAKENQRPLPVDDLQRLVLAMLRVLKELPKMPREVGVELVNYAYRFLANIVCMDSTPLLAATMETRVMEAVKMTLDVFFRDAFRVDSTADYVRILRSLLLLIRNWATAGCVAEVHVRQLIDSGRKMQGGNAEECLKVLGEHLNAPGLLNLLVKVVFKLTDVPRQLPEVDEDCIEEIYVDAMVVIRSMLKRTDYLGNMRWDQLDQRDFERLLENVKEHSFKRRAVFEDEEIINTLYLMTKQGFLYERAYFPAFLMEVAYGDQCEGHTLMQDIAAVCCAIISTQNSKDQGSDGPTCDVSNVVSDHAKFVAQLTHVPDPRMQLWHYRLLVGWSLRPKVLDEVGGDDFALKFVVDGLLDELLGRYSVVLLHNISVLRYKKLLTTKGLLCIVCKAYRRWAPGGDANREDQRRLLRRLLIGTIRNCCFHATDLQEELSDEDLDAIVGLCDCIEVQDTPLYLASMLHICKNCADERSASRLAVHAPLAEMLLKHFSQQAYRGDAPLNDSELYEMLFPEEEAEAERLAVTGDDTPMSPTSTSKASKKSTKKMRDATTKKGLGKTVSLYQQQRMPKPAKTRGEAAAGFAGATLVITEEARNLEQEWVYFATSEILTHVTFREVDLAKPQEEEGGPLCDAVDAAFEKHPIARFLATIKEQVVKHQENRRRLTDFFMQVTLKFIWHCWAMPSFRPHFETPTNLEALSSLLPFVLRWPDEAVQHLAAEVALFAGMHRYSMVTNFLVKSYLDYPELAAAILSKAIVDDDAVLKPYQACEFVQTFNDLLRSRSLSRTGLHRLAIGLMMGLVSDHPEGFGGYVLAKEPTMLGNLLQQLNSYSEAGTVKQCMVVVLVQTVGRYYKAVPDLDDFVLRILDLAGPLLDTEFLLFFPVLHRLAAIGGKRVKSPLVARHLHMRAARILEDSIFELEHSDDKKDAWETTEVKPELQGMTMNARQKVQWILAFFAALASAGRSQTDAKGTGHDQDLLFDAFVCVDLLPVLVRVLQKDPLWTEVMSVSFLLGSVARSPCLVPHMPDFLRLSEKTLPTLLEPDGVRARAARARMAAGDQVGHWEHVKMPPPARAEAGVRRNFVHLLGNAGFVPAQNPALLAAPKVLEFLAGLDTNAEMFDDPAAPLHVKVYCLAQLCALKDKQKIAMDMGLLEMLQQTEERIAADRGKTDEPFRNAADLRLPWVSCIVALVLHFGPTMMAQAERGLGVKLILTAMRLAQEVLKDSSFSSGTRYLHVALECQQALSTAIGKLCTRLDFGPVRAPFIMYLLTLVCSAPLLPMRTAACELLVTLLSQGHEGTTAGAVFLKTPCLVSFRQMVAGPTDELAISTLRVMQAFAEFGGYDVHVHLLPSLDGIMGALGDPTSNAQRCLQLAELFVVLTKEPTEEVLDVLIETPDLTPFLGLGRSSQASRRELVLRWLEAYGSSLYEIDEVAEVFGKSTMRGLLHLAARSTLTPDAAQDLRRIMFGLVQKRVDTWRASLFGVKEYLSEILITALLPMCERQPDLIAAIAAMFHTCLTNGDLEVLQRIWTGGHFDWLIRQLGAKSRAQLFAARAATGIEPPKAAVAKAWDKHADLTAAQAMFLRLLWKLYDMVPIELSTRAVKSECLVKTWTEYLKYYAHYAWPLRETREIEEGTGASIILAMQLLARVAADVNAELQSKLIQQGVMGLCLTLMLPSPSEQKSMESSVVPVEGSDPEDTDTSEALVLQEARLVAGAVAAWLMQLPEAYRWFSDRRNAQYCRAMFCQLHHWRTAIFEQQGSVAALSTVGPLERYASLYVVLLSSLQMEWFLEHVGLGFMGALSPLFLDLWSRHANLVIKHHALRMFSSFCQIHVIYSAVLSSEGPAKTIADAMHSTFGIWDVRALRHVLRLVIASLCHALAIPVLPAQTGTVIAGALKRERACQALAQVVLDGGLLRANIAASRHLLLSKFLSQIIGWCEQPGDSFGRIWALWLALTLLRYEAKGSSPSQSPDQESDDAIFVFSSVSDEKHILRRARFRQEAEAAGKPAASLMADFADLAEIAAKNRPSCRIGWLRSSPVLARTLAQVVGKSLSLQWKPAQQLACLAAARLFYELPEFQQIAVESIDGQQVVRMFEMPDKTLNLAAVLLTSVLSSFRLQLKASNLTGEFLKRFYDLSATVIEGFGASGEAPFDLASRWLHVADNVLPCEVAFRSMLSFLIGQCVCPPLAVVPSLELEGAAPDTASGKGAPPVAECDPPPAGLLDKLAYEIIKEEQRLKGAQVDGKGPLFSTLLCHLLYALAVVVPLHAKIAAHSATVRGAAFAQLMKVQSMMANSVQPPALYDPADGKRAKLWLYIKATACIRSALQVITGSWPAADFGPRFSIAEEGGQDFIQYCTKHINQVYNNKTALTRVLGTPWERLMLSQGPTSTIAELLLNICCTDANLKSVAKLGGEQALHSLSRYGENSQLRQQATMLLTKLAVMQSG